MDTFMTPEVARLMPDILFQFWLYMLLPIYPIYLFRKIIQI